MTKINKIDYSDRNKYLIFGLKIMFNKKLSVVVLDDHPVVREGLLSIIELEPDLQVVADSGHSQDAASLVGKHYPDVLVLDIQMDTLTFKLAKHIRETYPETKVLFITGFDTEENLAHATIAGANGLVSKLEGARVICEAIRKVSIGESYFSAVPDRTATVLPAAEKLREPSIQHPLSPREVDVLRCVGQAMTAKDIAKDLHISVKTVDRHKANIMGKLSMRSQIELARYAIQHGFVEI